MEADADIHSQALAVQLKKREEGLYEQGEVKTMMRKSIETADLSSWELTDSRLIAGSLHGNKLGPLPVGNSL